MRFSFRGAASSRRLAPALALVFALVGSSWACGSPPPPAAPAAVPKPIVEDKAPPPPDLSAVPRPESMLLFARLSRPEASLKIVGGWTKLPMPGAEVVSEIITNAPVGKVVDLSQPIDLAIAIGGDARAPDPQVAVSAAVRSLEDARGAFSERYKLGTGPNGAVRIRGLSGGDGDEDDHPCELAPAFGPASTRLICADGAAALEVLEPWLARSAPRDAYAPDLHVDVRLMAVRPIVQSFRGMLPMIVAGLLDARGSAGAVTQAIDAAVGDVADLTNDLESVTFDASLSDPGADAALTATFGGTTAAMSRLALAHPERADVPPGAFWHAPAEADVAYFTRGVEPRDIARARELGQNVILAALEKQGLAEGDRKPVVDAMMRYFDLFAGPIVYAKGLDMTRVDKARVELDKATDANRKDAENAFMAELGGWAVVQTGEPIAKVTQIAKDLSAALARPGLVKWAKTALDGAPPPSAKIAPMPKGAQLPDGSVHLEVTVHEPAPSPPPIAPVAPGAKPKAGAAPALAKRPPPKPRALHVFIVPDSGKSWLAMSANVDLAVAKARAVLPNAPDTGTLAKRTDLDGLRDAKASSGGFVSARGILAPSPFRFAVGATKLPRGPLFEGLANTPAQGATPIVFSTRADAKGVAGAFVVTGKAPRGAIEDIVKVAMRKW